MQCKEWSDIMGYVRGTWLLKRVSKSYWCTCSCAGSRRYWSHFHRARSRCSGKNGGFQRKILVSAEVKKSRDWINHENIGELASFLGLNIRSVHFVHGLCLCMILCFFGRQFQFYNTHPWRLLVTSWPFEIFLDQTRKRGVETRHHTYFLCCPQWLHRGCRQQLAATTTEFSEQQSKWFFTGRFCCWFNLHQSAKKPQKRAN